MRYSESHVGTSLSNDPSRGIMYQCRMQYLKSREGNRSRKKICSLDNLGVGSKASKPKFACLDEQIHSPCSPDILIPPNELMTRPKAFRQAYWKYHCQPTTTAIKKLDFAQHDGRKERLTNKRKEILARIRATEMENEARRESELRRRESELRRRESELRRLSKGATKNSTDGEESDESDESDSEETIFNAEQRDLRRGSVSLPPLSRDDRSTGSASNRNKLRSDTTGGASTKRAKRNNEPTISLPPLNGNQPVRRKSNIGKQRESSRGKENKEGEDELSDDLEFSFLSDCGKKDNRKVLRW